jgi:PPM family protein phosphatase
MRMASCKPRVHNPLALHAPVTASIAYRASTVPFDIFSATDPGRARSNNEDAVMVDAGCGLAVLADGMGGYNAGEVASGMATQFICGELSRWLRAAPPATGVPEVKRAMDICCDNANRAIFNAAHANPQYAGMGTTLVMAVAHQTQLLVGHVGDARAYRWRGARLEQITRDHSLLQEQIDAGLITPAQAAASAHKNLVTRAVGVEDTVLLEIHAHEVQPGDIYLLCSDGLSDMLSDAAIAHLLNSGGQSLEQTGSALITAANDAGGRDNISVILMRAAGKQAAAAGSQRAWWPFRRNV